MEKSNKKNLVCLHGALGCAAQLEQTLAPLKSFYNLYFLDFPGHGKKANQIVSLEACVAATRNFIREQKLMGTSIFGYSMGGYVALLLAKQNPELVGKIITLGTKLEWNPEIAAAEVKKLNPVLIQEKVPHYAKMLKKWHGNAWKNVLVQTALFMQDLGRKPLLNADVYQSILHPVLVLLAENDNMVSKEETQFAAQMLPFATFQEVAHSAHPIEKVDVEKLQKAIACFVE